MWQTERPQSATSLSPTRPPEDGDEEATSLRSSPVRLQVTQLSCLSKTNAVVEQILDANGDTAPEQLYLEQMAQFEMP